MGKAREGKARERGKKVPGNEVLKVQTVTATIHS